MINCKRTETVRDTEDAIKAMKEYFYTVSLTDALVRKYRERDLIYPNNLPMRLKAAANLKTPAKPGLYDMIYTDDNPIHQAINDTYQHNKNKDALLTYTEIYATPSLSNPREYWQAAIYFNELLKNVLIPQCIARSIREITQLLRLII